MKRLTFVLLLLWQRLWNWLHGENKSGLRRKADGASGLSLYNRRRKPDWVRKRVVWYKANDLTLSVRQLAGIFNRRYGPDMTVSPTFVWDVLKLHQADVRLVRANLHRRQHRSTPSHRVWGLDLCGKIDLEGKQHSIFGILDHGPRACISLTALRTKASVALLRALLDAIERFGVPQTVRTDNEACFTSRLFRFGLWLLGTRHQRIDLHCPWQNGRIERFFGTLKEKLNRIEIVDFTGLNQALVQFRCWYNHVRPHQHLANLTPAEAWAKRRPGKRTIPFTAWEGLLTGYYHPPDR